MSVHIDWQALSAEDTKVEDRLREQGFKRVRNDTWLRKITGLWDRKNRQYTFYWNPETNETVVYSVSLIYGRWNIALGKIRIERRCEE